MRPRLSLPALLVILLVLLDVGPASAQQVHEGNQTGFPPFGSFHGTSFDNVNLNNRNLHIEIPILRVRQRGRDFTYRFIYDTNTWTMYWLPNPNPQGWPLGWWVVSPPQDGGWRLTHSLNYGVSWQEVSKICGTAVSYFVKTNWQIRDPDGTSHQVAAKVVSPDPQGCEQSVPVGPTLDGSGMVLDTGGWYGPATIKLRDGSKFNTATGTLTDPNGNIASSTADMLGRNLLVVANGPTVQYTSPGGRTAGGPEYTTWTVKDSNGASQVYRLDYEAIDVQTNICGPPYATSECIQYGPIAWVRPSRLTLPTGKFYRFFWANNSYGELSRVDLPTGASIEYTYSTQQFRPPSSSRYDTISVRRVIVSRTVNPGGTWTYSSGTVTDPLGNQEVHTFAYLQTGQLLSATKYETEVKFYEGSTLLRKVTKDYALEPNPLNLREANARVIRETTTLDSGQVSKVETDYETIPYAYQGSTYTATRLNVMERREYSFGASTPGPLARKTVFAYLHTGNQAYLDRNIVDRVTSQSVYDGAGNLKAQTLTEYDSYTEGIQATNAAQRDPVYGPSFTTRGNITAIKRWRNTDGALLTTRHQYEDTGNIGKTTDPRAHSTTFSYNDSWSSQAGGAACAPSGGSGRAYRTQVTNTLNHSANNTYYSCTGLLASTTDPNLQTTSFTYDFMNRPDLTSLPGGGQTDLDYDDTALWTRAKSLRLAGSHIVSYTHFDSLGRPWRQELCEDGSESCAQPIRTDATFDVIGRQQTTSNPYRSPADSTYGISTLEYDALSRTTKAIPPDGTQASNNVTTTYSGNCTTVTDQAGKKRKSCADALGRLIEVWEPDPAGNFIYQTVYTYDVIDNLLTVQQKGNDPNSANWRTRTFAYNSLSQLTQAVNPESGTITYTYDNDGNLLTKTAPKPNQTGALTVTTTYTYDALHRLTGKSYNDGATPAVSYFYDQSTYNGLTITNGIGRRTGMSDGAGAEAWSYDSMGSVLTSRRTTNGVTKQFSYTYNLDGSLASLTYPSGQVVNYTYNAAGRALSAVDQANGINYATNGTYAPHGALATLRHHGTDLTWRQRTLTYNARLQPLEIRVSNVAILRGNEKHSVTYNLTYDFGFGAANNGNVLSIAHAFDADRSQTFTYDELNRIQSAQTQATTGQYCWGQTFAYDPWANLTTIGAVSGYGACTQSSLSVVALNNNRLSGFTYDAAGNMTTYPGYGSYSYDAENRMKTAAGVTYTYDGDGKRVMKNNGTLYWHGPAGEPLVETDLAGNVVDEYIFFNGQRIARRTAAGAVYYFFSDHLGSSRIVTDSAGTVVEDSDFYPFGGERVVLDGLNNNYKFTGQERDAESGLDYFIARHYAFTLGRFLQPDPVFFQTSMLTDPQRFNQYTYARNNPLSYVDPTGEAIKLSMDPEQRRKQLAALCQAVGPIACTYFYANAVTRTDENGNPVTEYYVGIYTNGSSGKGPAFESINPVTQALGRIINDPRVAVFRLQPAGSYATLPSGHHIRIGPVGSGGTPGMVYTAQDGRTHVVVMDTTTTSPGTIPSRLMSDRRPGTIDSGYLTGHEFGHVRYEWSSWFWRLIDDSNASAVRLENDVRRLRDPNAPTRKQH
ncbi:MAG: RHS repeat-associated core domain-containing protein [bacterium]